MNNENIKIFIELGCSMEMAKALVAENEVEISLIHCLERGGVSSKIARKVVELRGNPSREGFNALVKNAKKAVNKHSHLAKNVKKDIVKIVNDVKLTCKISAKAEARVKKAQAEAEAENVHYEDIIMNIFVAEQKAERAAKKAAKKTARKAAKKAKKAAQKVATITETAERFGISEEEAETCVKHANIHRMNITQYMRLKSAVDVVVESTTAKAYQCWEDIWFLFSIERKNIDKVLARFKDDAKALFNKKEAVADVQKKNISKNVSDKLKAICQHKNGKVIKFTYPTAY